ncbi:MAG TPA: V-type ATP synthase subunit D [Acidimicrobiales bacterium]|nr:V-type ATP synthase subunit D [Acidimicrobiales bacterium]
MTGRPPPGRAGRIWLAERIATAGRAAELLEHKQELLRRERRRLAELAERTEREWRARAATADRWNARALVAGGREELRRVAGRMGGAEVRLEWASRAGVAYPATAAVSSPPAPAALSPAVAAAAEACRRALDAGVQHAATATALGRVDAELVATVRRLRAIRDRWLPELRERLAALELGLEETEREEVTRLRWAGAT